MYYVIIFHNGRSRIEDAFEDFEAAKEYVMLKCLDQWCKLNDFVSHSLYHWWIVTLPIGYMESDNMYSVSFIDVVRTTNLRWFPYSNGSFQKNRSILIHWLTQTRKLASFF